MCNNTATAVRPRIGTAPIRTEADHDDYFTVKLRCPSCRSLLAVYSMGRAWTQNGITPDDMTDCIECGEKIDWSGIPVCDKLTGEG